MGPAYRHKIAETTDFLKSRIDAPPRIGLMTGTGLGGSAGFLDDPVTLAYRDIPHFPVSTAPGHAGRLQFGDAGGCALMVMQGRFHLYEGYTPLEVTYPIRIMQALGVGTLILTNAAGGLNQDFAPGDIMVISDHLNLTGSNPLVGPNDDDLGDRFPDMSRAYTPDLADAAQAAADRSHLALRSGVYAGLLGPSLETPAEIRYLQRIGADAVGLSSVHEAIAGVHAGMRVLGLSIITNTHDPDHPAPAAVEDIIAVASEAAPILENLMRRVLEQIHESEKS